MGMGNNPINGVDPDGSVWIPDENGNLIAEAGDNVNTLMDYLGISYDQASSMFYNLDNWNGGTLTGGLTDITGYSLSSGNPITQMILAGQAYSNNNNSGSLSEWKPNIWQKWGMADNFAASFTYSVADGAYVTGQFFTPWRRTTHIDGQEAIGWDKSNAFATTASNAIPFAKTPGALNAAQFSKLTKGTFVARLKPQIRGKVNSTLNGQVMQKPHRAALKGSQWLGAGFNYLFGDD